MIMIYIYMIMIYIPSPSITLKNKGSTWKPEVSKANPMFANVLPTCDLPKVDAAIFFSRCVPHHAKRRLGSNPPGCQVD